MHEQGQQSFDSVGGGKSSSSGSGTPLWVWVAGAAIVGKLFGLY